MGSMGFVEIHIFPGGTSREIVHDVQRLISNSKDALDQCTHRNHFGLVVQKTNSDEVCVQTQKKSHTTWLNSGQDSGHSSAQVQTQPGDATKEEPSSPTIWKIEQNRKAESGYVF